MTARVWHTGKPPHVGWWNASIEKTPQTVRWGWWDGVGWSCFASFCHSGKEAKAAALENGLIYDGPGIIWTYYWPENARVPRINPETGEVTGGKK